MSVAQCASCGHRIAAAVLAGGGPAHCPRCGDPLPADAATVTVAPPPPAAAGGSTVAEGSLTAAHDAAPPAAPARLPSIPGYELLEVIGRGGMGVVYKARQLSPRRVVALKMILGGAHAERFRTEVAAVARLQHPNVVQIHEVGEVGGRPFFSMEFVPGGSLATHLRGGHLPPRDAAALVAQLARAVQHAHDRGIVHRDLKPANILLSIAECGMRNAESKPEGERPGTSVFDSANRIPHSAMVPKIADFGLAKHLEGSADGPRTQSGAILGTPHYMAPEQAKGKVKEVGPATDVWALGAILYECLTGRPPFREDSQLDTLMKVISEDAPPPRRLRPEVPRDLEVICLKCLRKEPKDRYASAGALAEDLARFLDGRPIAARARTARERVVGWAGRRREYLFLLAGALLVGGLALGVRAWWPRPDPDRVGPTPMPASHLPPDLRLVPPDAFAFLTVRSADLWANPAARELLDHHAGLRDKDFTHDAIGQELERITSIHPRDIERATFVWPHEGRNRGPLIVLSAARPYSHDRLDAALTRGGKHERQEVGGRRLYVPTASKNDLSFLAYSDRVLVLGDPDSVLEAATGPARGVGPLTPVLERAAGTHTLVAGMRPSRETVAEALGSLGLGPEADPVVPLHTIGVTADLSHPDGPNGRVTIDLAGEVAYPSAEHAEAARPHLPAVVRAMVGALLKSRDGLSLVALLGPILEPVKAAAWGIEGDGLRASARGEFDLGAVKVQLEESIQREKRVSGMRWIATAMRRYHDQHGRFPPAVVTDADGKPLYSWRVLLLPHLNEGALYRRFHLNRAWDHPSNKALLDQMPAAFAASGAGPGRNATPYQVLTGPGGLFDSPEGRALTEVADDPANTILFVEAADAVPWTKPADVPLGDGSPRLGAAGSSGFLAVTADGSVRYIPRQSATPALLRGLFTRAGGEMVSPP